MTMPVSEITTTNKPNSLPEPQQTADRSHMDRFYPARKGSRRAVWIKGVAGCVFSTRSKFGCGQHPYQFHQADAIWGRHSSDSRHFRGTARCRVEMKSKARGEPFQFDDQSPLEILEWKDRAKRSLGCATSTGTSAVPNGVAVSIVAVHTRSPTWRSLFRCFPSDLRAGLALRRPFALFLKDRKLLGLLHRHSRAQCIAPSP